MNIAWCITGAGHYLQESFAVLEKLAKSHKITTFLSESGEEVVKAYGLWSKLKKISPGKYLQEIFTHSKEGSSSPSTGRFFLGKYEALIISPATANTVAKIAHGISDTLVTNAASHAMKCGVPVYICSVDRAAKKTTTTLPYYIDKELCRRCKTCEPANRCERGAIISFRIDLLRCNSCGICESLCRYNAIIGGKKVGIKARKIDVENLKKLKKMEFVRILNHPEEILRVIKAVRGR
ncbi:MAG: dihydromethanopterin reductase (acceptor) [Methanobacteriota archaeon]